MSEVIWISTESPVQTIESRLRQDVESLRSEGIMLTMEIGQSRKLQLLSCQIYYQRINLPKEQARLFCRQYIANALADVIVEQWQPTILSGIMQRQFGYLDQAEQDWIVREAHSRLLSSVDGDTGATARKSRVREALFRQLVEQSQVNLDGLLKFRLKAYQRDLEEHLAELVEQCVGDKENQEFVHLLQGFLQILEPKIEVAHLLITGEAQFAVLDEQGEILRADDLEALIPGDGELPEEYEDVMISALLSISPRHLIVHAGTFVRYPGLLLTLQQVWRERLEVCTDCDLCVRLLFDHRHPDQI